MLKRKTPRTEAVRGVSYSNRPEGSVEDVRGDQLFEIRRIPPAELERLGTAEEHLLVVLDRERDAAPDLSAGPRGLTVGLAAEELRHRALALQNLQSMLGVAHRDRQRN